MIPPPIASDLSFFRRLLQRLIQDTRAWELRSNQHLAGGRVLLRSAHSEEVKGNLINHSFPSTGLTAIALIYTTTSPAPCW